MFSLLTKYPPTEFCLALMFILTSVLQCATIVNREMQIIRCDLCSRPKWYQIWKWFAIFLSNRHLSECRNCKADFCVLCQDERKGMEGFCSADCEREFLALHYNPYED